MENFPVNFPNKDPQKTEHLWFTGVEKTEQSGVDFSYVLWYNEGISLLFLEMKGRC